MSPAYTKPGPAFDLTGTSPTTPTYKLNSGHEMPVVAYGTYRSAPGEVGPAVIEALKAGYRHLDLAHVYRNEKEIGGALKQAFDEGIVKREDLFITGKLWNSDHDVDIVPQACDTSLKDLQIDHFDLYVIHFPICWKHTGLDTPGYGASELGDTSLIDTWHAMEALVDAGKTRSIGVSNYPLVLMHDLTTQAKIQPACNQIEVNAYYQRESLVNYCLSRGICVTAHTPLGGGATNTETWGTVNPLTEPLIKEVADACGKSPAQVLLRWLLQRGICILPKSVKPHRMAQNIDLFDFSIPDDGMDKITTLERYHSFKSNPNPLPAFLGGKDAYSAEGTDIFD